MSENKLTVVEVAIGEINPSEYNPRAISKKAMAGLKRSIKQFGFTQPLVVNKRSGVLVGGHQRLQAAVELGFTHVPVTYVDLSEDEEKLLNVVLNNKHIEGFFTDELQVILDEIKQVIPDDLFDELELSPLVVGDWETDFDPDATHQDDPLKKATITIECPPDLKDEVLIFIKARLLETSFEGVHVR
jgi:hypothetical protein